MYQIAARSMTGWKIIALLLLASVCLAQEPMLTSGEYFVMQSWSQETDFKRPYYVHVPDNADQRLPVFIFLHGNGGNAQGSMRNFMRSHPIMASKYIMVFPNGYQKSWNIVSERSQADDRQFIEAIVATLAKYSNVQPDNFSIMGNSNGAALVNQIAIESKLPQVRNYITAVSPLNVWQHDGKNFKAKGADNNYQAVASPMKGKRLLNISGTEDRLVPYHGGPSNFIPAKDGKLAFVDAEASILLWARQMGSGKETRVQPRIDGKLAIFSYLGDDVVHYKVMGEGHGAGRAVSEQRLLAWLENSRGLQPEGHNESKRQPFRLEARPTYLMVDDYTIAEQRNVRRVLGRPRKLGVVMRPSVPTDFHPTETFPHGLPESGGYYEFGRRLSVLWNERDQKFQMLYRACGESFTAYAESLDGLEWTKPKVSRDGNSNLITHRGRDSKTFYEASFMIDPTLPWGHPEKYKSAFNPGNTKCAIGYSADGIHWTSYNDGESVTGRAADTFNQILWDSIGNRYLLLTRTDLGADGGLLESRATRVMVHDRSNDLMHHPTAWKTLANINVDEPTGRKSVNGVPLFQMESMNVWIHEGIYFGLMHVLTAGELTGAEDKVKVLNPDRRPDADVIDYYIGTSRDGFTYDMSWVHARKPFIERGPDGSFDKAMLQPSSQIITRGDEHFIYYTGQYNRHHSPKSVQRKTGKIGLAKLPRDRFIGYQAGNDVGTITTKPFQLQGDEFQLNVDAASGSIKIELLNETGTAIEEFAASQHDGVDELNLQVKWSAASLQQRTGETVRLRFTLQRATLYAWKAG